MIGGLFRIQEIEQIRIRTLDGLISYINIFVCVILDVLLSKNHTKIISLRQSVCLICYCFPLQYDVPYSWHATWDLVPYYMRSETNEKKNIS